MIYWKGCLVSFPWCLWRWDPGHHHFVITFGHWGEMEWEVEAPTEKTRWWGGVTCSLRPILLLVIPHNISPSVCSSPLCQKRSLLFSHSLLFISNFLHHIVFISASISPPRLNPIPSHSHLSNSYPLLSISSAPYPSYSASVGMTDCWNWADSPPAKHPFTAATVSPPIASLSVHWLPHIARG